MGNSMKDRKINNNALEVIMRDVLYGMSDFTEDANCGSQLCSLEITAVESEGKKPRATARVLAFPGAKRTSVK